MLRSKHQVGPLVMSAHAPPQLLTWATALILTAFWMMSTMLASLMPKHRCLKASNGRSWEHVFLWRYFRTQKEYRLGSLNSGLSVLYLCVEGRADEPFNFPCLENRVIDDSLSQRNKVGRK